MVAEVSRAQVALEETEPALLLIPVVVTEETAELTVAVPELVVAVELVDIPVMEA